MGAVVISIIIVFLLIVKKIDSTVSNERILSLVNKWHLNVKNTMTKISISPYESVAKEILGKWFGISFVTIVIINFLSIAILGNNSDNNLLENDTILIVTLFMMIVLVGLITGKEDYYFMIIFLFLTIGISGYFLNQEMSNPSHNINIFEKFTFWTTFSIASILIVASSFIMLLIYKLTAYIFYVLLKYYFKFCIYLNPQKPVKPLIFLTEILIILLIPVFHLINATSQ